MTYRTQQCLNCEELEKEIKSLKEIISKFNLTEEIKIYPWGKGEEYVQCPQCKKQRKYTVSNYPYRDDVHFGESAYSNNKLCIGKRLFKNCPKIMHFHRKCITCGFKFIEYTAENNQE